MKKIAELPETGRDWAEPVIFKAGTDDGRIEELIAEGKITGKNDGLNGLLAESKMYSGTEDAGKDQTDSEKPYGNWVYFPWLKAIMRYPERNDFENILTSRNRNLITPAEQKKLGAATVAVFGLSVGSNAVRQLVQTGIGKKYLIGDMDTVALSNLNRTPYTASDLGGKKTAALAKIISVMNPYIQQVHLPDGYAGGETDRLLDAEAPDIIIEAVDSVSAKVMIREYAKKAGIPLVMATDVGERVLLDVENYRDYPKTKPFNGRVSARSIETMKTGDAANLKGDLNKIVGLRNVPARMIDSMLDASLRGMPQLGSTAAAAAADIELVARDLLLGRKVKSGRRLHDRRRGMRGKRLSAPAEYLSAVIRALRYLRSLKTGNSETAK